MTFPMRKKLFLLLVVWRVSSVFVVQTSHVPDEYWQSLEVAHKLSFGYGYLTWEWINGIRSYMYPFLISLLFSLLKFLSLDTPTLLIVLPRIFQALLTAYADYRFYVWTGSKTALFLLCINWYWYYCATRTLINTFETCLTIIALSEFPWTRSLGDRGSKFLWIIGFVIFVRPTAIIVWIPLCLGLLYRTRNYFVRCVVIGMIYLIVFTIVDIACYGRFVFTPWNFFQVNVLDGISEQYGKNHLLWYFTNGLPVVLGLNYGLLAYSFHNMCESALAKSKTLLLLGFWTIAIYSFLAHKELRFILPTLPMFLYIINEGYFRQTISESKKNFLLFLLIISNIFPALYFSTQYQQGPLKVMNFLRTEIEHRNPSEVDIVFLTKCHSTPYYSHLHKNVSMNFLTCEPNLNDVKNYVNDADYFFDNPAKWVKQNYLNKPLNTWPLYVITYDTTAPKIIEFIKYYTQLTNYSDTHFPEHGKFNEYVIYRKTVITKDFR
ncbi:GPI mannosyltransferase 3 isoform X1 [Nasonia vitripennis]|uniref:Mannosyltransferase n=1 Tax=Nasonia vitripennis TaxID=7425 RepID=A0A7M7G2V5_NASVI|nr:GPI mannosyltransferase 3 isoform X1 [Nasonia vitripennis]XP_031785843.1 GPI mannosyltransferase 3 isoform X1 [Nasonia vitripennis]